MLWAWQADLTWRRGQNEVTHYGERPLKLLRMRLNDGKVGLRLDRLVPFVYEPVWKKHGGNNGNIEMQDKISPTMAN